MIKSNKRTRKQKKAALHGLIYGMGAPRLAKMLQPVVDIHDQEAKSVR